MASTDPIADMLAALQNGSRASLDVVRITNSRFKQGILRALRAEGFVKSFRVLEGKGGKLEIQLVYGPKREPLLNGVKRVSRPGRRVYVSLEELNPIIRRLEVPFLSTSQGILTGAQAKSRKVGGELLCLVW
jgi:small subunit ribosomal protein S8